MFFIHCKLEGFQLRSMKHLCIAKEGLGGVRDKSAFQQYHPREKTGIFGSARGGWEGWTFLFGNGCYLRYLSD